MQSNETNGAAAAFKHRDEMRRKRLDDALAAIHQPLTRSPEEVDELRARLDRLQHDAAPTHREVIDLDVAAREAH